MSSALAPLWPLAPADPVAFYSTWPIACDAQSPSAFYGHDTTCMDGEEEKQETINTFKSYLLWLQSFKKEKATAGGFEIWKPTLENPPHTASRLCPPPPTHCSPQTSQTSDNSKDRKWNTMEEPVFISGYTPYPLIFIVWLEFNVGQSVYQKAAFRSPRGIS